MRLRGQIRNNSRRPESHNMSCLERSRRNFDCKIWNLKIHSLAEAIQQWLRTFLFIRILTSTERFEVNNTNTSPWRWWQQDPPARIWYPTATLHSITTQRPPSPDLNNTHNFQSMSRRTTFSDNYLSILLYVRRT